MGFDSEARFDGIEFTVENEKIIEAVSDIQYVSGLYVLWAVILKAPHVQPIINIAIRKVIWDSGIKIPNFLICLPVYKCKTIVGEELRSLGFLRI